MTRVTGSARALFSNLIDYAGLFPPAALSLTEAVNEYRQLCQDPNSWALGRFVCPESQLPDLATLMKPPEDWSISVLMEGDFASCRARISKFRSRSRGQIDCIELKGGSPPDIHLPVLMEVPIDSRQRPEPGQALKIRTGGLSASAFPSAAQVAGFLLHCREVGSAFKATAGLHHALPGSYPVSSQPGAVIAPMQGLANLLVAAALAYSHEVEAETLEAVLNSPHPDAFQWHQEHLRWGSHTLTAAQLQASRRMFALSVGSCSFLEPIGELSALGWI